MFRKPSAAEVARESRREIGHASRDLEREMASLAAEEKKLLVEIKKAARTGNEAGTRALAKNLVRVRQQISRMQGSKAQLRGIGASVQTAHSSVVVAGALGKAGSQMRQANAQIDPIKAQRIALDFQKESAKMDQSEEVLGDTLSGVLDSEDIEDESDAVTQEVLDSLGIETRTSMVSAPRKNILNGPHAVAAGSSYNDASEEDDLERRLAALKG